MEVENWNLVGKTIYNVEIINMCFITGAMNLANKMQIRSNQHVEYIYTITHTWNQIDLGKLFASISTGMKAKK